MTDEAELIRVASQFPFADDLRRWERLGAGHIHDTFRLSFASGDYLLQRINQSVFADVVPLMRNSEIVCDALAAAKSRGEYPLQIAAPLKTSLGELIAQEGGGLWRASTYLAGSYALDRVETAVQADAAGHAFGSFAAALCSVEELGLELLLPNFHHLGHRLAQLETALSADLAGRASEVGAEANYCLQAVPFAAALESLESDLPRRVTHNDTKVSNLLFSSDDDQPLAVVDLDTCMPGYLMHDFGDLVRSSVSSLAEDASPEAGVTVRESIFAALARGYLKPLRGVATVEEQESLWLGGPTLCLLVGTRFLTDYLNGDSYFSTSYPTHNLVRARNQLALHTALVRQENRLRPLLLEQVE